MSAINTRTLLVHLDQTRALRFRLHDVINKLSVDSVVPTVQKRKVDEDEVGEGETENGAKKKLRHC